MDGRARDYVRTGQRLLASDLIFSDGLEMTESAVASIERARASELQAREAMVRIFERRRMFALAAAAAAAVLVLLLLLPRVEVEAAVPSIVGSSPSIRPVPRSIENNPADLLSSDAEGWSVPTRIAEPAPEASASADTVAPSTPAPVAPAAQLGPAVDLNGVASLCTQLARVDDTLALPPLLERAANLLDASGIILWIADPDGRELNPILAQGYPSQLIARLGAIPRDAENATAAAFRTSLIQTVKGDSVSNGAIAAPLVTPDRCVGVMAAEVRNEGEKQDVKLAAAAIVAAQLATLVGPPTSRTHNIEAAGA
jgi:hypothetical protein